MSNNQCCRHFRLSIGLFFTLFLYLNVGFLSAEVLKGKVVEVKDGDTIVLLKNNRQYKIRLASIDCPEKKQAFGTQAKLYTSRLAFGKLVTAKVKTQDRYGRYVAEIILPYGRSLNRELVRNGFAWHYVRYSYDKSLAEIQKSAQKNKLGLWIDRNPIPPWEFRRQKRK